MRRLEPAAMPMCLTAGWRFFFGFEPDGSWWTGWSQGTDGIPRFGVFLGGHNIIVSPFLVLCCGDYVLIIFGSE